MKLILVVEDEYGIAEVLKMLLEHEGYRVAVAGNGRSALEELATANELPAVIISDFMMPHMTGGEFGQAVRASAAHAHIPIIMCSATSEPVVRRAFADYDAFSAKPSDLDELLALVARFAREGRASHPEPRRDLRGTAAP